MSTKYCNRCDQTLPMDMFTKAKSRYDGVQAYCQECMKLYRIEHYRKNKAQYYARNAHSNARARQYVLEIKNTSPCVDCGVMYPGEPWLLDFDHLPEHDKVRNISEWINSYGFSNSLVTELQKCELVCLICHRRRTAERGGWVDNRLGHLL